MPVNKEFSGDDSFTLNWTVQQYSLNSFSTGKSLLSPNFESKKLGDSRWRLELFPRGSIDGEYVACYVCAEMDDATGEYDSYTITMSLLIGDSDFCVQSNRCDFQGSDCWKCERLVSVDELKSAKLPDDELKIRCVICPEQNSRRSDLLDMKCLSQDLVSLLESEKNFDFVLVTDDDTRFKVHQCIMTVRWPQLKDNMEMITESEGRVSGINSQTLRTMIGYTYSGILNETNVPRELFKAAVKKEFSSLRKNLTCFPKAYYAVTELNLEHKIVVWHFGDITSWERTPMSFIRVLPIIELYVYDIIIAFSTKKDNDGDEVIDVAFRFSYFKPDFPISLNCKMHLSVKDGDCMSGFRESQHLFLNNDTWHLPLPIKMHDIPDKKLTSMTLELTMSDGPKYSRIDRTETEFFSNFTPLRDLRKLSSDLSALTSGQNYPTNCFLKPKTGSRLPVHRIILWARWPQVRPILEADADEVELTINTNIEEGVLMDIIHYIYSGVSEDINTLKALEILGTKGVVPLPEPLLQKCQWILENEHDVE